MKTQMNAFNKYFSILYKRLGVIHDWRRAFGHEKSLLGYLNRIPIVLLGRSGRTWLLGLVAFARFSLPLVRSSGFKGLAIYLKVSHTVLIKAVAGTPIKGVTESLGHRVAVTRTGIPKMIPRVHRRYILRGDMRYVRFWSSVFSIYRVLDFLGKPNLRTITQPGTWSDKQPFKDFVLIFFTRLFNRVEMVKIKPWEAVIISKSGPGVVSKERGLSPKFRGRFRPVNTTSAMIYQVLALKSLGLLDDFKRVAFVTKQQDLWLKLQDVLKWATYAMPNGSSLVPEYLGKLGIKEEPGKVRVFAMVDWWTQMLLRPIHKALFGILSQIDSDATMDQDAAVERGQLMLKSSGFAASYDLSAATDRLPVELQAWLLDHLWPGLGEAWRRLLVARSYRVPDSIRRIGMKIPISVTYAVGQPMGALSSWAMLALTHHFVVQMAAYRCGKVTWFSQYLVLGDDIVIFDRDVAKQYLMLMALLGVKINLVKSVVSTTSFEFAKRFITLQGNLSPVSFKEMDVASCSLDATMQLFTHFRGQDFTASNVAKFSGAGYRVLATLGNPLGKISTYWANIIIYCSVPGRTLSSAPTWLSWLGLTKWGKWDVSVLNLQSLKDKFRQWVVGFKPSRLTDSRLALSGPELGAGLRPDSKGVLRFNPLFNKVWALTRPPNGTEEKLIQAANRILYKATLNTDLDKRQINEMWKDIELFWDWNSPEEADETLARMFDTLEFVSAREMDPQIHLYKPEPNPKRLAPTLLRIFKRSRGK